MHRSEYPTQHQLLTDVVEILRIFPIRVIVAGSRGFDNYPLFDQYMQEYFRKLGAKKEDVLIYSGMCPSGADLMAVRWALENGYLYLPFPADWERHGKGAGMIRNREMGVDATHLLAFYDMQSRGTGDMIKIMEKRKCPVEVIDVAQDTHRRIVHLYTIQMAQWRVAKQMNIKLVDITAKSGVVAFAPDYEIVLAYKRGEVTQEEYTKLYLDRMTMSRQKYPKVWAHLKQFNELAFACYCNKGDFCHRHLFINLAQDYLEQNYIETQLRGELTAEFLERMETCQAIGAQRKKRS